MPLHATSNLIKSISHHVNEYGTKLFWITPAVHQSDSIQFTGSSATERFEELNKIFPGKVSLLHGGMTSLEKNRALSDITCGRVQILVTTSVVEIGIDIPDVSVCIIDRAERFGLSQLHQIRGRIGRGKKLDSGDFKYDPSNSYHLFLIISLLYSEILKQCMCVLLYDSNGPAKSYPDYQQKEIEYTEFLFQCAPTNKKLNFDPIELNTVCETRSIIDERLQVLIDSSDGFEIADHDLKLRGSGDLLGIRQHGVNKFRYRRKS